MIIIRFVFGFFSLIVSIVTAVVATFFRSFGPRVFPQFKAVAFRLIGQLKPVYRESYRTHGLSLKDAHPA